MLPKKGAPDSLVLGLLCTIVRFYCPLSPFSDRKKRNRFPFLFAQDHFSLLSAPFDHFTLFLLALHTMKEMLCFIPLQITNT